MGDRREVNVMRWPERVLVMGGPVRGIGTPDVAASQCILYGQ